MATTEFKINNSKFTPHKSTVNGKTGYLWCKRELVDNAWIYCGQLFFDNCTTKHKIKLAFDALK